MSECEPNLPLVTFAKCYGQYLPLRVRVEEGFYGNDERSVISSGDAYNFHFIRNEKTMCIQDSCGTHFSVPFNSAISFGLIYNPFNEPISAVRQYSFTSAGEIITSKCPPRIIRATKEFKSKDPKSSVFKDEILIVKRINQSRKKRKEYIRVHSLLTGEEKILYRQCEGHFLTDPGSVRLYLPEIAEFFQESLPIVAKIFVNSDVTDDSVSSFASEVVKMTHISIESAIIATSWNAEETGESEQCTPIAIPIDLKIEVSIIESQPGDNEDLYQMTRELFEGFHPSAIKDMKQQTTCTSDSTKKLRRKLKGSIRKGHERQGVEVEKPTKAYRKKSKIKHTESKAVEFNQPREDDNRHRERRVPSISYSTFISESRVNSRSICKPTLDDRPISFSEGPQGCSNSQKQSHPSVISACTLANTDGLHGPLSAGIHTPFGTESVTQTSTDAYSSQHYMYDTPKKLAYQPLDATPVWGSFTDHQLENGNKMKPIAVPPCVIPSHQSLTSPINKTCPPVPQDVENKSVPLHNTPVSTETYDIPRRTSKTMSLCVGDTHLQMPNYGTASNECDSSDALSLTSLTLAPVVTSDRTQPLSEMIKSHPLLKHQHVPGDHMPLQSTCKCGNRSSSPCSDCEVAHAALLKNDPTSSQGDEVYDNKRCLSTTLLESSTPTKWSDVSSHQQQATEYSHVISASMNRVQTLIARNIQELKQLDCQQMVTLLENMNLSQYTQCFHREGIDGEIFAECDENVLLYELNVRSQTHRSQLMNIITGKQSVTLLLSGQGIHNYVKFGKNN